MPLNALLRIDGAKGETRQLGKYKDQGWIELQSWDWEVEAETSWTKGGGASVGKPNPGKMNWEHYFDSASTRILGYIFSGQSFPEMELHMLKSVGANKGVAGASQGVFFRMLMKGVFITKVGNSATDEGNVVQKVEMVFKEVTFEYAKQSDADGSLGALVPVSWDIPSGKVAF